MPACDWLLVGCAITKYLIKLPSMIFEALKLQSTSMTGRYTHPNFISAEFCTAGQVTNGPQWSANYPSNLWRVAGRRGPVVTVCFPTHTFTNQLWRQKIYSLQFFCVIELHLQPCPRTAQLFYFSFCYSKFSHNQRTRNGNRYLIVYRCFPCCSLKNRRLCNVEHSVQHKNKRAYWIKKSLPCRDLKRLRERLGIKWTYWKSSYCSTVAF